MKEPQVFSKYHIEDGVRRVLLFQPAVCDIRFPWIRWQQPVPLLQLATALHRKTCDLRLADALTPDSEGKIPRKRLRQFLREDVQVNYWRWGLPTVQLLKQLDILRRDGWNPEDAYILCGPPHQWEGCREAVNLIHQVFPSTRVLLFGPYPTQALEHAQSQSGADALIIGPIEELTGLPLDLSLCPSRPGSTHLAIGSKDRPISDLLNEFHTLIQPACRSERISHIILADQDVFREFPDHVQALCLEASDQKPSISLYCFGGIHPETLMAPGLAELLFHAGFKQILFTDDHSIPLETDTWMTQLENYRIAVSACCRAGYQIHSDELVGSICLGRPSENLNEVVARMTHLAYVAGSVILRPYQPAPEECDPNLSLEECNGKLFPFAAANGNRYRDYLDALGLAAILNARYRSKTFDFSGNSLISRLVRSSLITESWRPDLSQNRPVTVGWFNKEGKWTRS